MDWDNIRVFLAFARAGQFSAAALLLRVDNGTVGRGINALEKSVGVRLFDRLTTGCVLTTAGDRLFKSAEEWVPEWIAPFDMLEIDMIEDLWRSGSIRRLARLVEAFLDACDNPPRAN
jgi:DNA-binding transcriptional LysR family regulator